MQVESFKVKVRDQDSQIQSLRRAAQEMEEEKVGEGIVRMRTRVGSRWRKRTRK